MPWVRVEIVEVRMDREISKCARDLPCQVALNLENLGQVPVVGLRPQVVVGAGIDELRNDTYPVTRSPMASLENGRHTKLIPDDADTPVNPKR